MRHEVDIGFALHRAHRWPRSLHRLRICCPHLLLMLVTLIGCAPASPPAGSESHATPTKLPAITERSPADVVAAQRKATAVVPAGSGPAVACPSQDFETFLKAYANDGKVRETYTFKPLKFKAPYYWGANTEPGDPRYPVWNTSAMPDSRRVRTFPYWYDDIRNTFVSTGYPRPSEDYIQQHFAHGRYAISRKSTPILHRNEDGGYDIDFVPNGLQQPKEIIFQFTRLENCWHLEKEWDRREQALLNCSWPKECREMREYEASYKGE